MYLYIKLYGLSIGLNIMQKLISKTVLAVAFAFATHTAFAQIGIGIGSGGFGMGMNIPINKSKHRTERIEGQVQQLKQDLNLTDDQVLQVRNLLIERDRANSRRNKNMSREDFDNRMSQILTPEQNARYDELKQAKREEKRSEKKEEEQKKKLPESQWDDVYR